MWGTYWLQERKVKIKKEKRDVMAAGKKSEG